MSGDVFLVMGSMMPVRVNEVAFAHQCSEKLSFAHLECSPYSP
jgi:hypothetical protein